MSALHKLSLLPATRPHPRIPSLRLTGAGTNPASLVAASFHSSTRSQNDAPKSPFQVFREVLAEEIKKNRELEQNIQQLQGEVGKVQDSETLKQARQAYERARLMTSIQENPKLRAAADQLRKSGVAIGDAVSDTLKTMEESDLARAISRASAAVSSTIATSTEPIRNTGAYKALSETIVDALDDSGSAKHAGYEDREARRARRARRLAKAGVAPREKTRVAANPEAGEALVLHKDAEKHARWESIKSTNPVFRQLASLRQAYDESENPVISSVRGVTDSVGRWLFDESETAQVTRILRAMDPRFQVESFHRELREYIIPEVVDAYLSADREALSAWCGEAAYNVLWATMEQYLKQGLKPESAVLDIRNVDISHGRILEDSNIPVFLVTFQTQEVLMFRNVLTKEIAVGSPDKVEQCMYAAVITRVEGELDDELTAGWKIVEMVRRSARSYL
ncbi:TIM44 subunit of mitochondria import inner membrane translocase [Clavulina sp. PMI_390]|nr:TIM44 subunit of mitochondria import inner membrane translocase [Clavulina sp. PMI_390]